ncbi:MAG: PEGA domain-containing protein, partial [Candidatus Latescibacteria bacterium]|nr:PEGA domain-containing protein [Candidatus Latescibacterota bacterium]
MMRYLLYVLLIIIVAVSCSEDSGVLIDGEKTGIVAILGDFATDGKPELINQIASVNLVVVSFTNPSHTLIDTLSVIENLVQGETLVIVGEDYLVETKCYNSSNNLIWYGSTRNVSIDANMRTVVKMTLERKFQTFTLSGKVGGSSVVMVYLTGDMADSLLVNDGENYSFGVVEGGNFTIKPGKSGYTFSPESKSYENVSSNQTQDFFASQITYIISGAVSGADGVTVSLTGDAQESQIINNREQYSFTVADGGNYMVTPSKDGFMFSPEQQLFSNVKSALTQDFRVLSGELNISSTPSGAKIFVNGTDSGEVTPATLPDRPVGDHSVDVVIEGYSS